MKHNLLGLLLVLAPFSAAFADDGNGRLGLSQIDFDGLRGPSLSFSRAATPESKSAVITNVHSPEEAKVEASASVKNAAAILPIEAQTGTTDSTMQKLEYVTPLLRGMKTDKGRHDSWITSKHSWRKAKKKGCGDPADEANLQAKSDAIREVLRRFSGDDAFADSQCSESCKTEGYVSKLTGVAVKSANGGTFKFVNSKDGQCRYRLTKKSQQSWKILRPARVKCSCLPG